MLGKAGLRDLLSAYRRVFLAENEAGLWMVAMSAGGVQQRREERRERGRAGDGARIGGISAHRLGGERPAVALCGSRDFHLDHVPVEQAAGMQMRFVSTRPRKIDRAAFLLPGIGNDASVNPVES